MIERIPEAKRGKFDIVDLIEAGIEPEAIRAAAEAACEPVAISAAETARTPVGGILTDAEIDAEIERLSKLSLVAYERERGAAARRFGMRATVLDKLLKGKRQPEVANGQGQPLDLPTPEPWPDPVDGAALLSEMTAAVLRYVVMEAGCRGDRGPVGTTCSRARRLPDLAAPWDYLGRISAAARRQLSTWSNTCRRAHYRRRTRLPPRSFAPSRRRGRRC